jgi:RNA recognition motif-containing protein
MQHQDGPGLAQNRVPYNSKPAMNGDQAPFPHTAFHSQHGSMGGYSERHPQRNNVPNINTSRNILSQQDMQTPGTGYDVNFTPLLPSQLLLGSPFQPGSPNAFASPQFQSFATFGNAAQNGQPHMGSPVQGHAMSPTIFHNMASPNGVNAHPYMAPQSPTNAYAANYASQTIGLNQPMNMAPGLVSGTSRTVYLGNIPPETSAEEILNHVRSGQIESVRLLPDKNCAFISFLDGGSATHFHSDAILKRLSIKGQDIKIGWGKPSAVPTSVALAVQQSQASRNVYLGNLPEDITEEEIREDLGKFGTVDTVKLVREKSIGFVHFLSIGQAVKTVQQLPQEPKWGPPRRVYYGKDRCAYISKTQQQNAAQYLGIAPGFAHVLNGVDRDVISTALAQQSVAAAAVATSAGGYNNLGNRTVYLGNIHPETTIEEICNVVRGGLLHHIRYIPDKHICFVTFIDPTSAASFYALSNVQGLMIHNRRLKIGWGKHSGALPPAIALAVSGGASRNVYVGNLDDSWGEDRLRQDFLAYGEIELVNTLREKSCAFVNFTNIANAIKAIEAIKQKDEYKRFKINFGKDRCGNPPRQAAHHAQNVHDMAQANGVHRQASPAQNGVMNPGASNPLMMFLQQQQGQPMHQAAHGQQHPDPSAAPFTSQAQAAFYSAPAATTPPQALPTLHAPSHSFSHQPSGLSGLNGSHTNGHGNHSSVHLNGANSHHQHGSNSGSGSVASAVVGGLLAPGSAAARAQHARAVSLPVFSQPPPPPPSQTPGQQGQQQGQQQQQQQHGHQHQPSQSHLQNGGYQNGYQNGMANGYQNGAQNGYHHGGYQNGAQNGYQNGYQNGMQQNGGMAPQQQQQANGHAYAANGLGFAMDGGLPGWAEETGMVVAQ